MDGWGGLINKMVDWSNNNFSLLMLSSFKTHIKDKQQGIKHMTKMTKNWQKAQEELIRMTVTNWCLHKE